MREILFKAKTNMKAIDAELGEWIEGNYLIYNEVPAIKSAGGRIYSVDPKTVSQYTGLKDKNNVRIFEGDIVRDKFGNIGIVKYSNHFLDWRIHFYKGRDDLVEAKEGGVKMFEWIYPLMGLKAIGSIHDNQELLSGNNTGGVIE